MPARYDSAVEKYRLREEQRRDKTSSRTSDVIVRTYKSNVVNHQVTLGRGSLFKRGLVASGENGTYPTGRILPNSFDYSPPTNMENRTAIVIDRYIITSLYEIEIGKNLIGNSHKSVAQQIC